MSYSDWAALGALLGVLVVLGLTARRPRDVAEVLGALLVVGALALAFGRVGYVVSNLEFFRQHPSDIASARSPGYAEQFALVGGFVGWLLIRRRAPALGLALLAALIGVGASVGCIEAGCAYGREVFWQDGGLGWLLRVDWPDVYLVRNPRWPTQVFTVGVLALAFAAAAMAHSRRTSTSTYAPALAFLAVFAVGDFAVQFVRDDPAVRGFGLRLPQWFDLGLLAFAFTAAFVTIAARARRTVP